MAQGLDITSWNDDKSPAAESSVEKSETVKKTRVMGSRRIFPPQFKLLVLDSYRNDLDCRGNQRATARKYNIHRRQIQKWLQCEQHLRTSVEENDKVLTEKPVFELPSKCFNSEIFENEASGGAKLVGASLTLNRSATTHRQTDAETRLTPVGEAETKVMQSHASSEARNLKLVAQKLYPRSLSSVRPLSRSERGFLPYRAADEPLDLKSRGRGEPGGLMPRECHFDETPKRISTAPRDKLEQDSESRPSDKAIMGEKEFSKPILLKENIDGRKYCVVDAEPECLVQKYINNVERLKFCVVESERRELLCARSVTESCSLERCMPAPLDSPRSVFTDATVPVESSCSVFTDATVPVFSAATASSQVVCEDVSARVPPCFPSAEKLQCVQAVAEQKSPSMVHGTKSFSPKRKWMESLQSNDKTDSGEVQQCHSQPMLPIKQRVKLNLRSSPAATSGDDLSGVSAATSRSSFSIERLCGEMKVEKSSPLQSPLLRSEASSPRSDWAVSPEPSLPHYPVPAVSYPVLPFPPPLILPHRAIPDLVTLHFKPETQLDSKRYVPNEQCNIVHINSYEQEYEGTNFAVKEEKMSDSEESMEVDVLSTTPVEEKSFDFSGYHNGKRRSFSVQFKLNVLDAFYNDKDCNKNQRATARKFNINRRQVQKWLSQEADLRNEGSVKGGKYLQRQRLGSESREECMQCPQHCRKRSRIEVNVKHCSDGHCLVAPDTEPSLFLDKHCLSNVKLYDNYLIPDSNSMLPVYPDPVVGWPNVNASALSVPNVQYMSWLNFDICHEKAKIY